MRNSWNRFIYGVWPPFYDALVDVSFLRQARRLAWERLSPDAGSRILIVGCGTGSDINMIPPGVHAVGIDLSPEMLARARRKLPHPETEVELVVADAENLPFENDHFDAVMLFLIVSVVPDPQACLAEAARVTRPDGRAVVFDKFLRAGKSPSWPRRCANLLTKVFGTDINRQFLPMVEELDWKVESDEGGVYRHIVLKKIVRRSTETGSTESDDVISDPDVSQDA